MVRIPGLWVTLALCGALAACSGTMPKIGGGGGTSATGGAAGASSEGENPELEHCDSPLGTMAVYEDRRASWYSSLRDNDLGSTVPVLRVMVQQSNCFAIVDRGQAFDVGMGERDLANSGELREGSQMQKGQVAAADYTMSPSIAFSKKGTGGLGGAIGGMIGGVIGGVIGGIKQNEASTTLLLVDNRSSVQLAAAQGSARNYDLRGAAGGWMGAFVGIAGYSDTPEGRIIVASFMDSYNNMVRALRNYRAQEVEGGLGTGGRLGVQQ